MATITAEGFVGKTQNEYFAEEQALYLAIDALWNLTPSTPDGLKTQNDSEIFALLDEAARLAYNSKNPNAAIGVELDIICALTGVFRDKGSPSDVTLNLTGVDATVIPTGSVCEDINGIQWITTADATISSGTATAAATATINGAVEANIGTITVIKTVIGGWQTVTNNAIATPGDNAETDAELRLRRAQATAKSGSNQIDNMVGEITAVDGVRHVRIYENDTGAPDGDGIPAHSIAPVVDGGLDADVAMAIYLKKNPGVFLHQAGIPASELVQSPNYSWQSKTINFGRPTQVDIVYIVDIINDGTLPPDVGTLVTQAVLDYADGKLISGDDGFTIGEDVAYSRMYTPVNHVINVYGSSYVNTLTINAVTSNVAIAFDEISRWTEANITVQIS